MAKNKAKHIVDIALLILMLVVILFQLTGQALHEYFGTGMLALIIIHVILNRKWYGGLFRGKYSPARIFSTIVILSLMVLFVLMAWSGITMSSFVFGFLPPRSGAATARTMHLPLCFWTYIFVCLHVGCHAGIMASRASKVGIPARAAFMAFSACLSVCGLISFIRLRLWIYMFMQASFFFVDDTVPAGITAFQYFLVMWLFIMVGFVICKGPRRISRKDRKKASKTQDPV